MEKFLNEKAIQINNKRAKREKAIYFLKDIVEYSELLKENGYEGEAEFVFEEALESYLNHSFDLMILFHVYADFEIGERILKLCDHFYGFESGESAAVIYYKAIDEVDSGNNTDENLVYEKALEELNSRKKGYVEEKLKIYRRYTSSLRKAKRNEEARALETVLIQFKKDGIWPLK